MTADARYARRAATRLNALLDEEGFPTDSLGSSDGGESIVWRSPHGFLRHAPAPGTPLRYLTMRHQVARSPLGSLLVYAEEVFTAEAARPRPGDAYVIARGDRLEVMQCQCSRDTLASFEPLDQQGISVVVPLDPPAGQSQGRIAGSVFAAISAS